MIRGFFLTIIGLLLFITPNAFGSAFVPQADRGGYALVLVDSTSKADLAEARDFIVAQGGAVAVVLPPHAILGWISPEVGARILGKRGIRSIHRSVVDQRSAAAFRDRETQIAIGLFNDIVSGRRSRQARRESTRPSGSGTARPGLTDCAMPHPAINKDDFIRNLRLMGAEESARGIQSLVSPQFFANSDTMDGTVVVAVFLLESTGGIDPNVYTWSQTDQTSAIAQVIEGLNWWVEQSRAFNLARPLQFTVVPFLATNPACQQPYEPVLHPGRDANLWIDQVMTNVGSTAGDTFVRVAAFDQRLKNEHQANWAFSMFIAYNPPPAPTAFTDGRASWAYLGGPHTNVLFRSFGWPLSRITSHETGHIFYACDEYFQPGYQTCSCSCAPEIRPQASNGNCQDAVCGLNSVGCVMRLNELGLCPFTAAQIGWTDAVPLPAPTPPASLVASGASISQVSLIWQDTSNVEDGFQIERRGGSSAEYSQIGVVSKNLTSFSDSGVLPNTAYAFRVRAFNSTGTSPYSNEATVVTPANSSSLSISTTLLPDATVGVSYSRTLVASGGRPDYSWLVESGALSPGLSLSQSGTISGTPSTAGTSNFSLRVTDTDGGSTAKAMSLVVKSAAPLTITTSQLPKGSVGATYSQNLGASGGQTPYTWSIQSGNLPEGLTLNQTGAISGTPEQAGSSSFALRLTDATGESVTATLSLVINPSALFLSLDTTSLSDAVVGRDYSQTLSAEGGNPPYSWEISAGSLPDGLRLSDTGVIAGKPTTTGEFEFDIRVSDQSGLSVTRSLAIDVDPPPQFTILTASLLPVAAIGVPYRVDLKATAGTQPYRWVKKKKKKFGLLPDGISVSSDGVLSGTPTAQGVFNFTLRATDAANRLASSPFTIEVGPPPPPLAIRTEALPQALEGLLYNAAIEAFGGIGPYTWAVETGALPDGLTMTPEGVISGRATSSGVASFAVRVRDALGTSAVKALFIVVSAPPPPLVILTVSLPETSAERFYSQGLVAAGGVAPYAWTLASGALSTGLNISADGTISGTPASPGTSVFAVRVTDSAQQSVTRTLAITVKPADKVAPFGNLETPDFRATLNTIATGSGWALDNVAVTKVEVLIDNQTVSEAIHRLSRPDIGAIWAGLPNAANAGFSFSLDTTKFSNGEHTLAVRLLDAAGNATVIGSRPVFFQNQVLSIQSLNLVRGKKGEHYSMQLVAVNGRPPYSWTITAGSLPSGVSLNAAGLISGTPAVFGTFSFAVRVADSNGASAVASLNLTVLPDIEPLRIVSSGDQTQGSTGVEYSQQLLFAGGVGPRVWSMGSGSLPTGLTLGSTSGVISGTPTHPGAFSFTVRLTDATPTTVTSNPIAITVVPGPLIILTTGDLTEATKGAIYSFVLQAKGGAPPYDDWGIATGELPAGLSLNAGTGVISGTPTEDGTFNFTVRLTDDQPVEVESEPLTIIVDPEPLVITSSGDLTSGELDVDYTYQLTFSGGRGPYVWSIVTGELPPGLALNTETGVISGKPTATGIFTFRIELTDDQPVTVQSQPLRIAIAP